jgi:hypothetical protein
MTIDVVEARSLLQHVHDMLQADGYDLAVDVAEDRVVLSISATASACEECLIPQDLMTEVVRDSLSHGPTGAYTGGIELHYPGTAH